MPNRKRSATNSSPPILRPRKRQSRIKALQDSVVDDPTIYRTPSNPQATFGGLPPELRLHIYSQLCESTIIHVHHHERKGERSRFTWTPCRATSSISPLLCANPKWSGLCEEEDRCTYKIDDPPKPTGFWGLASSCKSIRNETQEFFLRNTVVSIQHVDLLPWLDHLAAHDSQRLKHLRRITLAGRDAMHTMRDYVQLLCQRLPNLKGIGYQCQDRLFPYFQWQRGIPCYFDSGGWRDYHLPYWMRSIDDSIDVAVESFIWRRPFGRIQSFAEHQIAIRLVRAGKPTEAGARLGTGVAWKDEDIEVEVVEPGKLVAPEGTANWRQWWRSCDAE